MRNGYTVLNKAIIILVTILACVGCDQATKNIVKEKIPRNQVISLVHDAIRIQYTENTGAFLSLGDNLSERMRKSLFIYGIGSVLLMIVLWLIMASESTISTVVAISVIVGGGVGNMVDRIMYGGYVVDFINLGLGSLRTGILNVADLEIFFGGLLLIFIHEKKRRKSSSLV